MASYLPILLFLVVLGVVVTMRTRSRHRSVPPIGNAIGQEPIIYPAPITPLFEGRKLASGMHLIVREHSFELSYSVPGGKLLGPEAYCLGGNARMKMGRGRFRPPRLMRDCIILTVRPNDDPDAEQEILLSSWEHQLREAWDALSACGVVSSGEPPDLGV